MGAAPRLRECVLGLTSSLTRARAHTHTHAQAQTFTHTLPNVFQFTPPDGTRAYTRTHTRGCGNKICSAPHRVHRHRHARAYAHALHARSAKLLDGAQTSHQGCSRAPVCRETREISHLCWGEQGWRDD